MGWMLSHSDGTATCNGALKLFAEAKHHGRINTPAIDPAKKSFQVCAITWDGDVVFDRRLPVRKPKSSLPAIYRALFRRQCSHTTAILIGRRRFDRDSCRNGEHGWQCDQPGRVVPGPCGSRRVRQDRCNPGPPAIRSGPERGIAELRGENRLLQEKRDGPNRAGSRPAPVGCFRDDGRPCLREADEACLHRVDPGIAVTPQPQRPSSRRSEPSDRGTGPGQPAAEGAHFERIHTFHNPRCRHPASGSNSPLAFGGPGRRNAYQQWHDRSKAKAWLMVISISRLSIPRSFRGTLRPELTIPYGRVRV